MFRNVKKRYNDTLVKYDVQEKLRKAFTSQNIKIFAVLFVITRIYKIYQLVKYV
jgi:hypothetical protein